EEMKFSLRECVEQTLDIFIEQVSKKNLELAYYIEEDIPEVLIGDATRLRQILVNLIGNAVKFTNQGHIYVNIECIQIVDENAKIKLCVEDTGIGIPNQSLDLLFKSFSQVTASQTRKYGGSGLGLAISKKLVELMGGEIRVESAEDLGSTFTFDVSIKIESAKRRDIDSKSVQGKTALVVEDSDIQRKLIARYLKRWGMNVLDASNPTDALAIAETSAPNIDIGILDLRLPDINGNELATKLRKIDACQATTFLSITASTIQTPGDIFNIALSKPIKPSYLFESINRCLKSAPRLESSPRQDYESESHRSLGQESPLSILLVDDNDTNRQVARMLLQKLGYGADEAANGKEAVDMSAKKHYDVVLMDVQMPVMDGKVATRTIREQDHLDEPWIIAVTAGAMRDDMENALRSGMDDYLSKPILLDTLKGALIRASDGIKMRSKSL
ncbi:MAG: response regulator, partial [Verrucomicrobiota bacterium]